MLGGPKMKKTSLTIGIPAYNEEQNIENLLKSLLAQKVSGFEIKKILVISDGSEDSTAEKVRQFAKRHPIVSLEDEKERKGKAARLNQLFRTARSKIVVAIDADMVLSDENTLKNLLGYFSDEQVALVGGNKIPTPPHNFIHRLTVNWFWIFYEIRKDIDAGDNIHNFSSSFFAIRRSLASKIVCTKGPLSTTKFLYFSALSRGQKVKFAPDAPVVFALPDNLKDYLLQAKRFPPKARQKNVQIFGDWIYVYYKISPFQIAKATLSMLRKDPLVTPISIIFNLVIKLIPTRDSALKDNGLWAPAKSSKRIVEV